ncbi:MAG: tetratricopeptide repeat protein [Alphaproteobacteria bacterium]|nr:tetratricopeptide repeat protein [Alphaproteobacteria bacterium]
MNLRTTLPLALALLGSTFFSGTALAQDDDRGDREERRVLRANDVDESANLSEEYRKLAREKRHQEIAFAKDLLSQDRMQGEAKAELMLRLADLYFEEGRDIYLQEMRAYEAEFDKCFQDETCDTAKMKPDNAESQEWQQKSIKLYKLILANYPTFARADEATFYLASALQDIGEKKDALKEFTRLVKTYPESGYVPDSYVQIGEYYFDNNEAYKALLAYQKAAAYRDSDKYAFAMYKLGWCYYNVGEYGKAIETMKSVVAYSMSAAQSDGGKSKSNLQLQEEALKDLVRFFADAGEMDEAYEYFNKLGKKELIRSMLKRLASTYFEQGKYEECIQTYRRLIAEDPNSKDAPDYQNEIIQAYRKIGKKDETLDEIDKLRKTYGKNSTWARTNATNADALASAQRFIEKNLRDAAVDYHNEAKKLGTGSQAKEAYALAYKAYTVYLAEFPDGKHTYEMRYAFGELLYKIKKFDEAFTQYMQVVEMDPKGKHSEFCAESAIFAAEEMVKVDKKEGRIQTAAPDNKTEPVPLSEWEQNMLNALDQYAKLFPEQKKTRNIIYKSAYLLNEKNQFKEAADRFRVVIGMDPKSREAILAANLILDNFALVEDWQNLKEVSKAFYDQDDLGNADFKKEVYNIYERTSFKLIEVNLEKSKDEAAAAEGLMAFYAEFPESEVADQALNNAAVYYFNTKQRGKAIETRLLLLDKFPKTKYKNDTVAALGVAYEDQANFVEAAQYYEQLFSLDKEHAGSADAIYSAALFRRAMGEWEQAVKDYQQYIAAYPDKENIPLVKLDIAQMYEENEKWNEAAKIFKELYTAKDTSAYSGDQLMYMRLHYGYCLRGMDQEKKVLAQWEESVKWFEKAREDGVEFTLALAFYTEMRYDLAEKTFEEYTAMRISGPSGKVPRNQEDKILGKQLTSKLDKLKEVKELYAGIYNLGGGEYSILAAVKLGLIFEDMATTFDESHVPSYLTEDQVEFYRMNIEDRVFQQQETAVEFYSTAVNAAHEVKLYTEEIAFAIRRLGELRPADYPELQEELLKPGYTSSSQKTASYETEL